MKMPNSQSLRISGLTLASLALAACGSSAKPETALVSQLKVSTAGKAQSLAPTAASTISQAILPNPTPLKSEIHSTEVDTVNVEVTLSKKALTQDYFYGADLQYSSSYDSTLDLYNQSLALGHVPVRFRIAGAELQLIADDRIHFPSDVNHPEQLISRFKILSQTADSITVTGADSGVYLGQLYAGTSMDSKGELIVPAGVPPRNEWIRSFEFDAKDNIVLQQSILTFADGTRGEFLESIFPRSAIATGSRFEKFVMDPNDPVGGQDGAIARYRFLESEKVFHGETTLAYAQHFDISPDASGKFRTIDWYVTPNIPDEDVQAVKDAVEGWNRYYRDFKEISQDIVLFKGRLPEGIHLGDPRFNVINWDNRLIAGAAYETQASDPFTGKQSHSMIYMPAAWLKIGTDYWANGQYSDERQKSESVAPRALLGHGFSQSARLACLRDITDAAALINSGRTDAGSVAVFGTELLKQTLFHEVGHALGLAHNFKGSLSYDPKSANPIFSTSIMDYNDFEIERQAFFQLVGSDGPKLEYDRQAISALYNHSADVADKDAVVPTCNDAEADTEDAGVDPLCIRYDIQHDPTWSVDTGLARVKEASLKGDVSLAQAIMNAEATALDAKTVAAVVDEKTLQAATDKVKTAILGAMKFYYTAGKASLSRVVRTNVKALLQFESDVLPEGYNELEMRERAFKGIEQSLAMLIVSPAVDAAVQRAIDTAMAALAQAPVAKSLAGRAAIDKAGEKLTQINPAFESSPAGLPKLRIAIIASLARHPKVPFFFGALGKAAKVNLDYETAIVGRLADIAGAHDERRLAPERLAAATSLASYATRLSGPDAIAAVTKKVEAELKAAKSNSQRELALEVLAALR